MIHYLVYIPSTYACRNKLEDNVRSFLFGLDRDLVRGEDIEAYKAYILERIKQIESENNRCRPLDLSFDKTPFNHEDFRLNAGFITFFLLKTTAVVEVKNG